jgi:hypothetical protein
VFRVSRGFVAALGGAGMTLLAWFGPWAWPGWPASLAIAILGKFADFADLSHPLKAVAMVLLIIINVGTWAIGIRLVMLLFPRRAGA